MLAQQNVEHEKKEVRGLEDKLENMRIEFWPDAKAKLWSLVSYQATDASVLISTCRIIWMCCYVRG